jgi:hypothetical protein
MAARLLGDRHFGAIRDWAVGGFARGLYETSIEFVRGHTSAVVC